MLAFGSVCYLYSLAQIRKLQTALTIYTVGRRPGRDGTGVGRPVRPR